MKQQIQKWRKSLKQNRRKKEKKKKFKQRTKQTKERKGKNIETKVVDLTKYHFSMLAELR
jgi:hypothetical protein